MLVQERNAEVRALRETNARQYEELQQLKGARQQSQQNGQQTAAKPMPGSDNMQDVDMHSKLHLEVSLLGKLVKAVWCLLVMPDNDVFACMQYSSVSNQIFHS